MRVNERVSKLCVEVRHQLKDETKLTLKSYFLYVHAVCT